MGIASVLGGNITLAGSTPQLVAQGILEQTPNCRLLTFFELVPAALPLVIVMVIFFATVGYHLQEKFFRFEEVSVNTVEREMEKPVSIWKTIASAVIFLMCVIGFTVGVAPFGIIAMFGACLCCLTGCITPRRIWETMDWRTIVVLGGSLGFASGMEKSGALDLIAQKVLPLMGGAHASVWLITTALLTICALLSNLISNTATAAIMTPFSIALAQGMGRDPIPFVIMVIIGCSLAFATPMSTPPITMTLIGGYRFTDYLKVGGIFNLIVLIVGILTIPILYGLV
ncbi:MAG: hypothetical protein EOM52_03800 [Clostridia bacterium]|nr:hypothetical protein [Clostridia bacterium]